MKKTNFTNHTPEDLTKFVGDKREELRAMRFAAAGSKNHNVKAARTTRKEIARALTVINANATAETNARKAQAK